MARREHGFVTLRWALSAASIALSAFILSGCAQKAAPTDNTSDTALRIAIEGDFPPFSEIAPSGELIGFDVDIASALCDEMKRKCEIVQQRWSGMAVDLLFDKYDMIVSSMHPTEERRKHFDFTDKYRSDGGWFIGPSGAAFVDTPSGMTGKTIGVLEGTSANIYVPEVFIGSEIRRFSQRAKLYAALYRGELDSVFDLGFAAQVTFLKSQYGDGFGFVGRSHNDPKYFGEAPAIAIRKNEDELKRSLNAAIKAIRANGKYASINSKYFDFDTY